jgi:hypothetical protein
MCLSKCNLHCYNQVEEGTFSYTSGANIIVMVTVFTETITHTLFAFSPKMLMYWGVPPTSAVADTGEYAMLAPPKPSFVWHMGRVVCSFELCPLVRPVRVNQ